MKYALFSFALAGFVLSAQGPIDKPNPIAKRHLLDRAAAAAGLKKAPRAAEIAPIQGTARLLVLLVEFGGTDTFEFIPSGEGRSGWDPFGIADTSEWTGTVGDCSRIVEKHKISGPTSFTYAGPLHNAIERPRSASDASGSLAWAEDFTPEYYRQMIFGNGLQFQYKRQDGSVMDSDATGFSLRNYYLDASGGLYDVEGEVIGWIKAPHSVWWYGAEPCPGRRSGSASAEMDGGIPGAGNGNSFVIDALEAAKSAYPDLDWKQFDADGDGVIDHLFVVHAGLGEEDSTTLLNRTSYGEATLWSSSASLSAPYWVAEGVAASAYIVLPENAALGVIAHEYAHNIGADDVYNIAGTGGESASSWTIMSDSWVGNPAGSTPAMFDALHLDRFGWLQPLIVNDPGVEYVVTLGQTSNFQPGESVYRGLQIQLPEGSGRLAVQPAGGYQWWGGQRDAQMSSMTLKAPFQLPPDQPATLSIDVAYEIEEGWDLFMVEASSDGGGTWTTLANDHTGCQMVGGWSAIGLLPNDLCAAGVQGFTGTSAGYPARHSERLDLTPMAGQSVIVRFRYFTDTAYNMDGPFVDNIVVTAGDAQVFADDAEAGGDGWDYAGSWERNDGSIRYSHSFYFQWRNTGPEGGFDRALADPKWSPGPLNTGLLVWYQNGRYTNNDVWKYLFHAPSFGPKGYLLAMDAHPAPYRHSYLVQGGYAHEAANFADRAQVRDAPFSRETTRAFFYQSGDKLVAVQGRPGVPVFSDSINYYPGLEMVSPAPRDPSPLRWMAADWNASAVMPSTISYPVRAPGYRAGDDFMFGCTANLTAGTYFCGFTGQKLETDGGAGDPASVGGQYGWNVEILEQTATQAKLRIWNSLGR